MVKIVTPPEVKRIERGSEVWLYPSRISLTGTNLDLVTKVTINNISITSLTKAKTRLSFNLPKTLEVNLKPYKIGLTYGNENKVLNTNKTIKVSKEKK